MHTEKTKKLILPVTNTDDYFTGFDHGIIELSQADIDRIRNLSEAVKAAKKTYGNIYQISCFDDAVTTMKTDYDSPSENGKLPLMEPEDPRIECCTLEVSVRDFCWTFYPKHSDVLCTTETVMISELDTFEPLDKREVEE